MRSRISLAMGPLTDVYQRLKEHPRLTSIYPEYLVLTHMVIRASVPLLRTASARLGDLTNDPVRLPLQHYFDAHALEETAHDEWVLEDLGQLGVDRAEVMARMPPPAVAALVGSQYYWVLHHHPVALLGYISVLEGYPAELRDIDEMIQRTGHPRAAFRTWTEHAALDPLHDRDLDDLIDRLPLASNRVTDICVSGMTTARLAAIAFEELLIG